VEGTNLDEACEESQIIAKDLKKYPFTSPPFLDFKNTKHDKSK